MRADYSYLEYTLTSEKLEAWIKSFTIDRPLPSSAFSTSQFWRWTAMTAPPATLPLGYFVFDLSRGKLLYSRPTGNATIGRTTIFWAYGMVIPARRFNIHCGGPMTSCSYNQFRLNVWDTIRTGIDTDDPNADLRSNIEHYNTSEEWSANTPHFLKYGTPDEIYLYTFRRGDNYVNYNQRHDLAHHHFLALMAEPVRWSTESLVPDQYWINLGNCAVTPGDSWAPSTLDDLALRVWGLAYIQAQTSDTGIQYISPIFFDRVANPNSWRWDFHNYQTSDWGNGILIPLLGGWPNCTRLTYTGSEIKPVFVRPFHPRPDDHETNDGTNWHFRSVYPLR